MIYHYLQGKSFYRVYWRDRIDGNGTGQDGETTVTLEPCSRPVPSRRQFHLPTADSYRPVPPRKSLALHFTVPSRRENIPLPSRPVHKTCPYRFVLPRIPGPTVPSRRQNLSLPSRPVVTKNCLMKNTIVRVTVVPCIAITPPVSSPKIPRMNNYSCNTYYTCARQRCQETAVPACL